MKEHEVTSAALDVMTDVIIHVEDFTRQIEQAPLCPEDRAALLRATSAIMAQADFVITWMLAAPLEAPRQ